MYKCIDQNCQFFSDVFIIDEFIVCEEFFEEKYVFMLVKKDDMKIN